MEKDCFIQDLTCLPGSNDKYIDYVLYYEKIDTQDSNSNKIRILKKREEFFKQLNIEAFEVCNIEFMNNGKSFLYSLLHCPYERLMKEAEAMRLEMKLKNCKIKDENGENFECSNFIKKFFKRPLKDDQNGSIVSTQFETSISFMFKNVDNKNEIFNKTIRMLIVNNILINLSYKLNFNGQIDNLLNDEIKNLVYKNLNLTNTDLNESDKIILQSDQYLNEPKSLYRGLPYMLNQNCFEDAFILHEETSDYMHLKKYFKELNNKENEPELEYNKFFKLKLNQEMDEKDVRKKLNEKWAKFKNIFKYQPLLDIKDYFGEANAYYFAWSGVFISLLWLPSVIGISFFIVGIINSAKSTNYTVSANSSLISTYTTIYSTTFTNSFDNDLMPIFALITCIWISFFAEYWKRENSHLAYEWDVENFENNEPDLPDYSRRKKFRAQNPSSFNKFLWDNEKLFKYTVSFLILLIMIRIVALDVALVVVLRIYIKIKVFPTNDILKLIFGDILSIIINTFLIMILNLIYKNIAIALTKWENHRTKTEYDDAMILKLFAFEFANSYSSLIYLAYFRNIHYQGGMFNLGDEYQDKCDNNSCMPLLTTQVLIILLIKPFPRLLTSIIIPFINDLFQKRKSNKALDSFHSQDNNIQNNDKTILIYLNIERNKTKFDDTIIDEYNEKIIYFGYLAMFSASFSLAPLVVLIIILIDLRVDAKRLLWLYRRPIGYKAQDIGSWYNIIRIVIIFGFINNGFMVAFTSDWSKSYLHNSNYERLIFACIFEHVVFIIWLVFVLIIPEVPSDVQNKLRQKRLFVKEIVSAAKTIKKELVLPILSNLSNEKVKESDSKILNKSESNIKINDETKTDKIETRKKESFLFKNTKIYPN